MCNETTHEKYKGITKNCTFKIIEEQVPHLNLFSHAIV